MLATDKQIKYLCALADKVEKIKAINKSAKVTKANLPEYIDWAKERNKGVTSFDASIRITAYKSIIFGCNNTFVLCNMKQV